MVTKLTALVDCICHTNGKGLWSRKKAQIHIVGFKLNTWDYEGKNDSGYLEVYFNTEDWNVKTDGLIYTDPLFESGLKLELRKLGLSDDIDYGEQGMQGSNYVDFDVSGEFIKKFFELTGVSSKQYKPAKPKTEKQKKKEFNKAKAAELRANLKAAAIEYFEFLDTHNLKN